MAIKVIEQTSLQQKKENLKKMQKILLSLWGSALILAFLILFFVISLMKENRTLYTTTEAANQLNIQILRLNFFNSRIPFLIEKYAFTLYSKYLQQYWYLLETDNIFDSVITNLNKYDEIKKQIGAIKINNRILREQEIQALKLIFSAYHIPEEIINAKVANYQLSGQQQLMTDAQKLQQAQDILFNVKRQAKINLIENTIHLSQQYIKEKMQGTIDAAEKRISLFEILLLLSTTILIFIILSILWLRLISNVILFRFRHVKSIFHKKNHSPNN